MEGKLFAIYKNGIHKGNVRAKSKQRAIELYVTDSMLKEFLGDIDFMLQYSAKDAISGIHYNE